MFETNSREGGGSPNLAFELVPRKQPPNNVCTPSKAAHDAPREIPEAPIRPPDPKEAPECLQRARGKPPKRPQQASKSPKPFWRPPSWSPPGSADVAGKPLRRVLSPTRPQDVRRFRALVIPTPFGCPSGKSLPLPLALPLGANGGREVSDSRCFAQHVTTIALDGPRRPSRWLKTSQDGPILPPT